MLKERGSAVPGIMGGTAIDAQVLTALVNEATVGRTGIDIPGGIRSTRPNLGGGANTATLNEFVRREDVDSAPIPDNVRTEGVADAIIQLAIASNSQIIISQATAQIDPVELIGRIVSYRNDHPNDEHSIRAPTIQFDGFNHKEIGDTGTFTYDPNGITGFTYNVGSDTLSLRARGYVLSKTVLHDIQERREAKRIADEFVGEIAKLPEGTRTLLRKVFAHAQTGSESGQESYDPRMIRRILEAAKEGKR